MQQNIYSDTSMVAGRDVNIELHYHFAGAGKMVCPMERELRVWWLFITTGTMLVGVFAAWQAGW